MGAGVVMNSAFDADFDDRRFQHSQRYKPISLDELVRRTKFNRKEIQLIYQGFKQECPSGMVDEDTFKNIYRQFFPFTDTSTYAHLVFATVDLRAAGAVTFEEFLGCLSTLCRGSLEDRLRWIFTLYDTRKSGRLTREDFHLILCAIYSLCGNESALPNDHQMIEAQSKVIFERFDKFHQGFLTVQDFLACCFDNPTILRSLESLRTTV